MSTKRISKRLSTKMPNINRNSINLKKMDSNFKKLNKTMLKRIESYNIYLNEEDKLKEDIIKIRAKLKKNKAMAYFKGIDIEFEKDELISKIGMLETVIKINKKSMNSMKEKYKDLKGLHKTLVKDGHKDYKGEFTEYDKLFIKN